MLILGVDPGETTGWCVYDSDKKAAAPGMVAETCDVDLWPELLTVGLPSGTTAVVERPVPQGFTRPQVVECAWIAGRLRERLELALAFTTSDLTRLDVRRRLQAATNGVIQVKNDATVWAALKLLHGGESAAKKGGPLYGVTGHCRAALAVAVAWTLPEVKS